MIYLASPYSHKQPLVRANRFTRAERLVAKALACGLPLFSPIVYCHKLCKDYELPGDAEYWSEINQIWFEKAESLWLLPLPGWEESRGVQMELAWAEKRNLPQFFVDDTLCLSEFKR